MLSSPAKAKAGDPVRCGFSVLITDVSGILARAVKPGDDGCVFTISRRDAPKACVYLSPSKTKGAGKAGCALHPRCRVQVAQKNAHTRTAQAEASCRAGKRGAGTLCWIRQLWHDEAPTTTVGV